MKHTMIAVYKDHDEAVKAVKQLKENNFNSDQVSIIGKAQKVNDAIALDNKDVSSVAKAEVGVGAALGTTLGVLAGVSIFAIPGLGFLYGAGALIGGIAGFDFGLIGGGIVSALTVAGIKINETQKYDNYISEGRFLLIFQGTENEAQNAKVFLDKQNSAIDIDIK